MRVLVAYATYYGSTRQIAARIADVLTSSGLQATLESVDDAVHLEEFDGFVIGSAIHGGQWHKAANRFLDRNSAVLERHPVWLFSSGPVGPGADKPQPEPSEVTRARQSLAIRDHVVFGGAFERAAVADGSWFDRAVGHFIPEGDFRDWAAIEAWAHEIAAELKSVRIA